MQADNQSQNVLTSYGLYSNALANLVQQFLTYVVLGEQAQAEALLKLEPSLLLRKGKVVDYSDRTIEGTALQMAMGAEDFKYHNHDEGMVEMIERYFNTLPDGKKLMTTQIAQQFPKGWEEKEKERVKNDLDALKKVVDKIGKSTSVKDLEVAVDEFKNYLKLQNKEVKKEGKHFNGQLLIEACKMYDENFKRFSGTLNGLKNLAFWRKIIGTIQRYLPACYAQAFCQGIYNVSEGGQKLIRDLIFRKELPEFILYYPLNTDPNCRLGEEYAASPLQGRPIREAWQWNAGDGEGVDLLTQYAEKKESRLQEFMQKMNGYEVTVNSGPKP